MVGQIGSFPPTSAKKNNQHFETDTYTPIDQHLNIKIFQSFHTKPPNHRWARPRRRWARHQSPVKKTQNIRGWVLKAWVFFRAQFQLISTNHKLVVWIQLVSTNSNDYMVLYIPGGRLGFLNHQQYAMVNWWFGARWFGFLVGSPKMKGIGILRGIPISNPQTTKPIG